VGVESRCLSRLGECLVYYSMRLGVPFIAPRQLGAIGDQHGRLSLPSVEWRTGQSGASLDSHCSMSGARFPSKSGTTDPLLLWARWRTGHCPVHTGQSDAPSRPLERATCRALIMQPTVGTGAVGSPDSLVQHRTVW
jgi:hypothetical protein